MRHCRRNHENRTTTRPTSVEAKTVEHTPAGSAGQRSLYSGNKDWTDGGPESGASGKWQSTRKSEYCVLPVVRADSCDSLCAGADVTLEVQWSHTYESEI
jgi:hypothetical protein